MIGTGTRGVIGEVFLHDTSAEGHGPENGDVTGSVVGEPEGDVGVSLCIEEKCSDLVLLQFKRDRRLGV